MILLGCQNTKQLLSSQNSHTPTYLMNADSCSLVTNQNMNYGNKKIENFWYSGSLKVVNSMVKNLNKSGYRSLALISDPSGERLTIKKINIAMIEKECRRIIKVVHVQNTSTEFGYDIEILEPDLLRRKGEVYKLQRTYYRSYRFPLTKKTFDTLSLSSVGEHAAKNVISKWKEHPGPEVKMSDTLTELKVINKDYVEWSAFDEYTFLDKVDKKKVDINLLKDINGR